MIAKDVTIKDVYDMVLAMRVSGVGGPHQIEFRDGDDFFIMTVDFRKSGTMVCPDKCGQILTPDT